MRCLQADSPLKSAWSRYWRRGNGSECAFGSASSGAGLRGVFWGRTQSKGNPPREMEEMGRQARAEYETKYTAERNYEMLMEIYPKAIAARSQGVFAEVRNGGIRPAVGRGC